MFVKTGRQIKVWMVDKDSCYRERLRSFLGQTPDIRCVCEFDDVDMACKALQQKPHPDVILMDINLSDGPGGGDAISRIRARAIDVAVIIVSSRKSDEGIFRSICSGARGYLLKAEPVEQIALGIRDGVNGGAPMSSSVAMSVLNMFARMHSVKHMGSVLSSQELKVLELISTGMLKKEVASFLSLSYNTVDTYLRRIYRKLNVKSRSEAIAKAIKEHIVS